MKSIREEEDSDTQTWYMECVNSHVGQIGRHVSYTWNFFAKYADVKSKKYAGKYAQYYKICALKYAELRNYKIYALKICRNAEY